MRQFKPVWFAINFLFLAAAVMAQTGRLAPGTGIITGTIQLEGGGPASGVRVAVIPLTDTSGSNLASLTESDSAGRFRLVNIPQGRYYVIAGRFSSPTFFPGSGEKTKAIAIVVEAAGTISNIDFKVPADSRRPEQISPTGDAIASTAETTVYRQASAEKDVVTKIKLLRNFETSYPMSTLLPKVYDDLMDLHIARGQPDLAASYGEKWLKIEPDNVWAMVDLSRAFGVSQRDLREAVRYGELAVSTVAKLKKGAFAGRPAMFRDYTPETWETTVSSLDASAASNLAWVKQVVAWHDNAVKAAVRSRR